MTDTNFDNRANLKFGWMALLVFAVLGLTLEGLHLIKAPWYMEMHIRRELWTLGHAHGTLLALVNIVYGLYANRIAAKQWRRRASAALRTAAVLMPLGFLLGGVANPETDPSIGIILVPIGALLLIFAAAVAALSTWQKPDEKADKQPATKTKKKRRRR